MKKKLLITAVVLIVVVIAVGLSLSILLGSNPSQPVALSYNGSLVQAAASVGWMQFDLNVQANQELHNCIIKVSYLSNSGSWVQVSKEMGIVDQKGAQCDLTLTNCQLPSGMKYASTFTFTQTDNLQTIEIDAYGYP
jgi:hypothetical protein